MHLGFYWLWKTNSVFQLWQTGFTIKDSLKELNIDLNLPPFMEERQQLSAEQVTAGRKIALLRIHVERAIGRIKSYAILRKVLPISMAHTINQIVTVCTFYAIFNLLLFLNHKQCLMMRWKDTGYS